MGVWWHALAFVTHERAKMSHKPVRNVTQAGPKCHTRAKMSHSHVIIYNETWKICSHHDWQPCWIVRPLWKSKLFCNDLTLLGFLILKNMSKLVFANTSFGIFTNFHGSHFENGHREAIYPHMFTVIILICYKDIYESKIVSCVKFEALWGMA